MKKAGQELLYVRKLKAALVKPTDLKKQARTSYIFAHLAQNYNF